MTGHSFAASTIAQAIRWVKETFIPRSLSTPLSALRLASSVSTASVLNEVAVGIERLSSIALASIAAGPRSGFASPRPPARAAAAAPSPSAAASTSAFVTLPPAPLPLTPPRSTPRRRRSGAPPGVARAPSPVRAGAAAGAVRGGRVGRLRCGAVAAGPPGASISARASPTFDGVVGLLEELGDRPARRRRDLGVDLVGRDLDHGLALLDRVALALCATRARFPRSPTRPSRASRS